MAETVLADAQFGIEHILRPFAGFESVYQGQSAARQIMLSEVVGGTGGAALDEQAARGVAGYDPALVKGLAVPLGARVLIWLPKIQPQNLPTAQRYNFSIQWRLRNVFDFRQLRTPYHYPKQVPGVPDTTGGPASPRVVLPVASQTTVYVTAEPSATGPTSTDTVVQNARTESVSVGGIYPGAINGLPFVPGGATGVLQQGILDPASVIGGGGGAQSGFYQLLETQAAGDELLIGMWRDDSVVADWDFGSPVVGQVDSQVSQFLGADVTSITPTSFPDIGVYVSFGTAP